tara:strand:- start:14 stop:490 length:477 start_codon:yes stop_codon:yes gene_type:complete
MRHAVDKMIQLYKTNPIFQDLVETAAMTGTAAVGQAALTDMTPQEIAIASAAGFGAGMVGRPIVGRAGQAIGGQLDRRFPESSKQFLQNLQGGIGQMPKALQEIYAAKMGPYSNLGGYSQYGNLVGRGYGDNVAQAAIALAAPTLFNGDPQDPAATQA